MANKDIKNRIEEWFEKADDFIDEIKERILEYGDKIEDIVSEFSEKIRDLEKEVRNEAEDSSRELNNILRRYAHQIEIRLYDLTDSGKYSDNFHESSIQDLSERAEDIKYIIRQIAKEAEKRIHARSDRFIQGIDKIREAIYDHKSKHPSAKNITSPMDSKGNYHAKDKSGTPNNYFERIVKHAENTKKRIRKDVEEASGMMRNKIEELENVYSF